MQPATRIRLAMVLFVSGFIVGIAGGAALTEAVFFASGNQRGTIVLATIGVVIGLLGLVLANVFNRRGKFGHL
jgi:hypothetical protein